jgi:CDP-glucose 4,6-dehydratase
MTDVFSFYKHHRVLVTGDTGFKGSWLTHWLTILGANVAGYALAPQGTRDLFNQLNLRRLIAHETGDIRNRHHLHRTISHFRPDIVFHLAAQPLVRASYADPSYTVETNVTGSANLLEAVRLTPSVRSLVFVTSDKCYKNKEQMRPYKEVDELGGHDPYSASKAAAELLFASYQDSFFTVRKHFGAASARAGNVIGGGDWSDDRIVPDCIRALQKKRPILLRHPNAIRPWQHVLDPLRGYLTLAMHLYENPKRYAGSWNFGPSVRAARTVNQVATQIISEWGEGKLRHIPQKKALHESQLLLLNCDKARKVLGWSPVWDVDRSIQKTAEWYRQTHAGQSAETITRAQIQAYMEDCRD